MHICTYWVQRCVHIYICRTFFSGRERKEEISSVLVNLLTLAPETSCSNFQNFAFWVRFWYHAPSLGRQNRREGIHTPEGRAVGRTGSAGTNLIWYSISTKSKSCPLDGPNSWNCRVGWGAGHGSPARLNLSQQPILATLADSTQGWMKWCRGVQNGAWPKGWWTSSFPLSSALIMPSLYCCCLQFGVSQYRKDTDKLEQTERRSPGCSQPEIPSLIIQLVQSGDQFSSWVFFCFCYWAFFFPFVS